MNNIKNIAGSYDGSGLNIAIIVAQFNASITDALLNGAVDCLLKHGVPAQSITVIKVPGAFELPYTARIVAKKQQHDAIICIGAVIRGETPHFDYVASQCAHGIMTTTLTTEIPIIFGVLTTDTVEQAHMRSGIKGTNNGWSAALYALEMATLRKNLRNL